MLDLASHDSLQSALREAFERFGSELCVIEADRDRERCRLTYDEVRGATLPLAAWLQERGAKRVAILMTNQSKWHITACAAFWIGATVVPLDPKLSAPEHAALLEHCEADTLICEHQFFRELKYDGRVLVTEAPESMDLRHALRFEACRAEEPRFVERGRDDVACIVYSSGTGGRAKGCMMTHGNYLSQCAVLLTHHNFRVGDRYLSILPTNHAIDFMVGFFGAYVCGATVVHLRTLRPEFVRAAFSKYGIAYMALVPMVLRNLETGLTSKFGELTGTRRWLFDRLRGLNMRLTRDRPNLALSRRLLGPVHAGFGGKLKTLFVGGAFTDPETLRFFYSLGIQVASGYGLTEAGTVVTLNDFEPYRPETVGKPLKGTEVRILDPDPDGAGEVAVRGPTVMTGYLKDPELTAETIVGGWLHTGDIGVLEPTGHLRLMGRKKNMIVTAGGKNVYPEDIENVFDGLAVKEFCIFAERYLWPQQTGERLIIVVRPEKDDDAFLDELAARNRRLPDFKRVHGYLAWGEDFPRTASMKIKRHALAEQLQATDPAGVRAL